MVAELNDVQDRFIPARHKNISHLISHIVPISLYVAIWAALMVCTGLTVFARFGGPGHL